MTLPLFRRLRPFSIASVLGAIGIGALGAMPAANAIELNWSGQFRSEFHYINGYTLDRSDGQAFDPTRLVGGATPGAPNGYYIPYGGSTNATFETLFLKVRPKLVVNDNIYIKSEWWLGSPTFGLYGNATPYTADQTQWYSNQSSGSTISAQRYWLELLSDFGTIQVGRVPLDWGLGVVWNAGDGSWDRYESTGDSIRLISKFGSFSFSPGFTLYDTGNNVGGTCTLSGTAPSIFCLPGQGGGGVADYNFALKYENLEDDFDLGVNFVRRLSGASRDATNPRYTSPDRGGQLSYNIWDVFGRKRLGSLTIAGELPIISGQMGGRDYSSVALATELGWKISESWETQLRAGHAPGQPNNPGGATPDSWQAFYFNPNYKLGMLMFNYQFANFAGYPNPNTANNPGFAQNQLSSLWDNPITNANYLTVGASFRTQKWTFNGGVAYAQALQTARSGEYYFNTWQRTYQLDNSGKDQSSSLGMEYDLGAQFNWDEYFTLRFDTGLYFPGAYYAFSNSATDNKTDPVWGVSFRAGVNF